MNYTQKLITILFTAYILAISIQFRYQSTLIVKGEAQDLTSHYLISRSSLLQHKNVTKTILQSPYNVPNNKATNEMDNIYSTKSIAESDSASRFFNQSGQAYFCAESWDEDLDDWWQEHPDWDVSHETNQTYCFSPVKDLDRAKFLREIVYPLQWRTSCQNVSAFKIINSGFSANIGLLGRAFLTAVYNNKTFVESKRKSNFLWKYATTRYGNATCPSQDMECYFLPISNCKAKINQHEGFDNILVNNHGGNYGKEIIWLKSYLVRPKLWMRRRIYEVLKNVIPPRQPCTAIHVRRTDVGLEPNWRKKRHYFAIADYLRHVKKGDHVLLLTDDQSAIDEVLEFHSKERDWTYIDRKRWRGTEGGLNSHLPSGDAVQELIYIGAEMKLATRCRRFIHTRSGFADVLLQAMQTKKWGVRSKMIDIGLQPNETYFEDADTFFAKLNSKRKNHIKLPSLSLSTTSTIISPECHEEFHKRYCCASSWKEDLDDWWQQHPDWDVSRETNQTYCFSPIEDLDRAKFLREVVFPLQWRTSCHNVSAFKIINSGFSANVGLLGNAFLTAVFNNKTFVESKRKSDFLWKYATTRYGNATCPSQDMDCYYLPISKCKAKINQHDGFDIDLVDRIGGKFGKEITWLKSYLLRPRLWMRRRIYNLLESVVPPRQPCTAVHVRRTDVGLEPNWKKKRHYFAIADYLKHVKTGDHLLLLTDDQSAVSEALEFHSKERNWTYLERKRWWGTEGGLNGHLPSGDAMQELVYIGAEIKLATYCRTLVFTRSGFAEVLLQAMQTKEWGVEKMNIGMRLQPNKTYFEDANHFFARVNLSHIGNATQSNASF
jgi:NADPH-dependent ferric siderophore reductase